MVPSAGLRYVPVPSTPASCIDHLTCVKVKAIAPAFTFCSPHRKEYHGVTAKGVWEPFETWAFAQALRAEPHAQVLDVGARSGWFSILAATRKNNTHHVIAVEANRNATCVEAHNAAKNGVSRQITIVNNGADKIEREMKLSGMAMHSSDQHYNLTAGEAAFTAQTQTVSTIRLDTLLPLFKSDVLVMKMDIEGFECEALMGAATLLCRVRVAFLMMEWDGGFKAQSRGCDWLEAVRPLREQGLQPYDTEVLKRRGTDAPVFQFNPGLVRKTNCIAWRQSRPRAANIAEL